MKQKRNSLCWPLTIILLLALGNLQGQTLQITSVIPKEPPAYKHWSGKYRPEKKFEVSSNGKVIKPGATVSIPVVEKKFKIRYDYEFQNGRGGAKEVTFSAPNDMKKGTLEFKWKNKYRLIIDGAEPKSVEVLETSKKKKSKNKKK